MLLSVVPDNFQTLTQKDAHGIGTITVQTRWQLQTMEMVMLGILHLHKVHLMQRNGSTETTHIILICGQQESEDLKAQIVENMHLTRDTGEFNKENRNKQVIGMRETTGMQIVLNMALPLKSPFK